MSTFDFEGYLKQLTTDIKSLASEQWSDYKEAVIKDSNAFVKQSREDLERWTALAVLGQISAEELTWLVKGKMDAAQLRALKDQGLSKVRLEKFRTSLVELLVGSVVKAALA